MNKQEWIAEFAKEFQAQTQFSYRSCFDVADYMYAEYALQAEMSPDEAVQEKLRYWSEG